MANETLIEVKNLKKTYKTRKAGNVVALSDVSFALPKSGMVFFLGKSGCGKSTLLNVLGGLDSFDGGEIIVGGRSIKNFTSKESDTYRNEYIGFVFQENNLLEGYTVAQNIGFALDIKKQSNYDDKVNAVLESVDLKDFAERKPNSLSGGQKQRVAIARALVKNPEIILADEPTGALDSDTGEEVFNLLKEISTQKLIIVVSHDRLSAQKFGDRIIELKDGKVLSDSSPLNKSVESSAQSLNFNAIKSGIPAKRVFSLGAGFLVAKPIRFAFCALICLIAFCCLGISDAFNCYDRQVALLQTMKSYSIPYISYERGDFTYGSTSISSRYSHLKRSDYEALKKEVNSDRLDIAYWEFSYTFRENMIYSSDRDLFESKGFIEMDESLAVDYGYTLYGKLPTSYDEVVLTDYIFNGFKKFGYTDGENIKEIKTYDDLIGCTITREYSYFHVENFKVVGILDTKFDYDYYGGLLDGKEDLPDLVYSKFLYLRNSCMHNIIYLAPGYYENVLSTFYDKEDENRENIAFAVCPFKGSDKVMLNNIRVENKVYDWGDGEHYSSFRIVSDISYLIQEVNYEMRFLKPLFFWISLGTIILSALFVLYYSSGVIAEKKRDLGVLRAMGASRADVIKIFLAENGIFVVGLVLLATLFSAVGVVIVNANFIKLFGFSVALISYSIRQIALTAAIAVGAVVVGIIIPLIKLLCAKPVDLIAGRK